MDGSSISVYRKHVLSDCSMQIQMPLVRKWETDQYVLIIKEQKVQRAKIS